MTSIKDQKIALEAQLATLLDESNFALRTGKGAVRTEIREISGEGSLERFEAWLAETRGAATKEAYLELRQEIRNFLRVAQNTQRARRAFEKSLKSQGLGSTRERESCYEDRIWERGTITSMLRFLAVSQTWSKNARAKALSGEAS